MISSWKALVADTGYTQADLDLFTDLERGAAAVGVTPCLIGAGAIQLGVRAGLPPTVVAVGTMRPCWS